MADQTDQSQPAEVQEETPAEESPAAGGGEVQQEEQAPAEATETPPAEAEVEAPKTPPDQAPAPTEESPTADTQPEDATQNANPEEGAEGGEGEGQEKPEGQEEVTTDKPTEEGAEGEGEKPEKGEKPVDEDKPEEGEKPAEGEKAAEGETPVEEEKGEEGETPAEEGEKPEGEEGKKEEVGEGEEGPAGEAEAGEEKPAGEGEETPVIQVDQPEEGEAAGEVQQPEQQEEAGEAREVSKSPVPQSDTFAQGERAESPVGVGERLSREGTPLLDTDRPIPDALQPGTPDRSRAGTPEEAVQLQVYEEEEEEEPEFDREELIERYHQAISEREQLQQQNYQMQHKLAEYFRKKKADESRQDYDKNVTDQEQRYLKYMAQLEDLRGQDMQERESYKHQIRELKTKCEDKKERVDEERQRFMEFKKEVALNALNSRSGRPIPPKDIEVYLSGENKKEADVVNVRLENIKLKNKLKKKEQQLKSKEELAEGLHLIDFEQLKIENQTYNEKIEERNEELLKLRKKITSTVQVLTHLKEKLQYVQAENQIQKRNLREVEAEVAQKRDILSRTKQARDALRIDNQRLRQNCGLLGNEPLLRDFEERKDEGDDLRQKLETLKMQYAELTLHCNQVRRKIEQARNGRA